MERIEYRCEPIEIYQLSATDLIAEAQKVSEAYAFRVSVQEKAERADALYIPSVGRMGIAWAQTLLGPMLIALKMGLICT